MEYTYEARKVCTFDLKSAFFEVMTITFEAIEYTYEARKVAPLI
jgi:hypothetical protein